MPTLRDLQTILTVLCGATLVLSMLRVHPWMPYASVVFGSYFALKAAYQSLRNRSIDVNFLMVFAAIGAVILGRPLEAAVLLFLFSLSSTLEAFAMARTRNAIEGLIKLRPDNAILVSSDGDANVPVSSLKVGDIIRVLPFNQIPSDGEITQGQTSVDQHAMTGESQPVPRSEGEKVLAGTQNLDSMILVRVTAALGDTTLEKIVDLVRDAQENKASGERISQWFGQRYTFFVIGVFVVALLVRLYGMHQVPRDAAYGALTLLVAMSPCALVISVPATTLSALAWAARNGMLIRGGEFIESAGRIDTLAVDKTGTLTAGRPELVEICVCSASHVAVGAGQTLCKDEDACWKTGEEFSQEAASVLKSAAAAEIFSTHPIAEAIVRKALEVHKAFPEASEAKSHSGLGVTATIEGKLVRVGQQRFFEQDGGSLPPDFQTHVTELQRCGMTVAIWESEGRYAALGLRDAARPEVRKVLDELRSLGVKRQIMLTGDTVQTAQAIAAEVGIDEVHAALLPDQKTALVSSWIDKGERVAMVGDGINDAPSLAKATIGVAMGGLGSDIALNAADVVIMQDKLDRLPLLIRLGRSTNAIIRANLIFAGGVIACLTLGALAFDALFPNYRNLVLPFAVVGHEGSTVLVILNGLRLLKGPR